MTTTQAKKKVEQAIAHANAETIADRQHYFDLFAPGARLHGMPVSQSGVEWLRSYLSDLWWSYPESRVDVEDIVVQGDRVALRYTWRGGHGEAWPAFAGTAFLRFHDGKVSECWQTPLGETMPETHTADEQSAPPESNGHPSPSGNGTRGKATRPARSTKRRQPAQSKSARKRSGSQRHNR